MWTLIPIKPTAKPPSLADLQDAAVPAPPVSWLPQAPGWWVLLALAVAALLVWLMRRAWRWWADRYRRAALLELAALEQASAMPQTRAAAVQALPALVKRTVYTWAPRPDVAAMSGDAWLAFLDRTLPGQTFTQGPGRWLERLAYGAQDIGATDLDALLALLRRWIRDHVPA